MAVANLCAAEPLMIARLRSLITGSISAAQRDADADLDGLVIDSGSVLANAADVARYCPAAFIMPGENEPFDRDDSGSVQAESQGWAVVICVAHYRDPTGLTTTAYTAGAYIAQVIQALIGWAPGDGFMPFVLSGRSAPYYEPGYAEFPVLFETVQVLEATA